MGFMIKHNKSCVCTKEFILCSFYKKKNKNKNKKKIIQGLNVLRLNGHYVIITMNFNNFNSLVIFIQRSERKELNWNVPNKRL